MTKEVAIGCYPDQDERYSTYSRTTMLSKLLFPMVMEYIYSLNSSKSYKAGDFTRNS